MNRLKLKQFCPLCGRAKTSWGWLFILLLGLAAGIILGLSIHLIAWALK